MLRRVASLLAVIALAGCASLPPPSVQLRDLKPAEQDHVLVSFSTDQLTRSEAQELLLLSAALVSRREGGALFQFRSVSATGLYDEATGAIRYYDIKAIVDPLFSGQKGDDIRKTYQAQGVIGFLGPKYRPLLPAQLAAEYGTDEG